MVHDHSHRLLQSYLAHRGAIIAIGRREFDPSYWPYFTFTENFKPLEFGPNVTKLIRSSIKSRNANYTGPKVCHSRSQHTCQKENKFFDTIYFGWSRWGESIGGIKSKFYYLENLKKIKSLKKIEKVPLSLT